MILTDFTNYCCIGWNKYDKGIIKEKVKKKLNAKLSVDEKPSFEDLKKTSSDNFEQKLTCKKFIRYLVKKN